MLYLFDYSSSCLRTSQLMIIQVLSVRASRVSNNNNKQYIIPLLEHCFPFGYPYLVQYHSIFYVHFINLCLSQKAWH